MKIRSIHIYSHDGRRRDLPFHDGLNVITGRSSTGKSALSDIIEYCMGRSTFNIPEGIIQERVSWYAVRYAFEGEEVLVAKPAPGLGRSSCSLAMVRRGVEVAVPAFGDLCVNDDDDGVVTLLSRRLGIPENTTDVPIDNSRESYDANIKHTHFYLFQKQTIVANKDQLFYRQNEQFQPQTIKDTLPILLGVSSRDRFNLESQLRSAQRDLRLNTKLLDEAKTAIDTSEERAIGLHSEARAVGILQTSPATGVKIVEQLREALNWKPTAVPEDDGRRLTGIENELVTLREQRREIQRRLDAAEQYAKRADGFQTEAVAFGFGPRRQRNEAAPLLEAVAPHVFVELVAPRIVDRLRLQRLASALAFECQREAPCHLLELSIRDDCAGIPREHLVTEIGFAKLIDGIEPSCDLLMGLGHAVEIAHGKVLPGGRSGVNLQHACRKRLAQCSLYVLAAEMMIRANDDELAQAIEIALLTAKTYAIRDVFSATRALNRRVAVDTLTARIVAALRPYEIMREARESDLAEKALPLFPHFEGRI